MASRRKKKDLLESTNTYQPHKRGEQSQGLFILLEYFSAALILHTVK